jgi:uncharacterized DUF497 family protein
MCFTIRYASLCRTASEDGEQRWQTFGLVEGLLLLMAAHTVREEDEEGAVTEVIRIISARYATQRERHYYENENS